MISPKPDYEASASPEGEDGSEGALAFHPSHITLSTFNRLLVCYPKTVEQVHRKKLIRKLQSKAKPKRKSAKNSADAQDTTLQKTDLPPAEEEQIQDDLDKFLTLDRWRYETLPKELAKRKGDPAHLTKDELIEIMAWKTSHGRPRPMLMGMIKANQQSTITKATSEAFTSLPVLDPITESEEAFPKASLDALTTSLRGVGPATASLILSIATVVGEPVRQVPFYSDDAYLWLVLGAYPAANPGEGEGEAKVKGVKANGELDVKYNLKEFRGLWDEVQDLRARLKEDGDGLGSVSTVDVEKVAYVLRHIVVSGYDFGHHQDVSEAAVTDSTKGSDRQTKRRKLK
ncbi:hypothetical protein PENANT_c012G08489 [Penicillium antarcticum]|uniref:Uncharacterized protein n=1 Tax=Penicillium antarcticum TaxID=416450 RepID=A0A1V6Q5X4_9EURO|nr:uncharacterized protein N7508_008148 [Penicillium antarcticum]KAJ5297899.1 hypothetical protein N7508_008148 [Penicillium antarcticum]OQD84633.1 hypothetical protein PENANT_c012G08489 [Penicillium antarcticum]